MVVSIYWALSVLCVFVCVYVFLRVSFRLWRWNMIDSEIEMKELGKLRDKAPRNTYNKRSLIRTSHVCHRRLVSGRSQQAEEYKHKHKHIHTHTHTHTHTHQCNHSWTIAIYLAIPGTGAHLHTIHLRNTHLKGNKIRCPQFLLFLCVLWVGIRWGNVLQ